MKKLIVFCVVLFLSSCKEQICPPCFNYIEPLRISFMDMNNNNLLNPNISSSIEISAIQSKSGANINFELKNTIGGFDTGFWFLESINRPESDKCIDNECEFYISYNTSPEVDTLNILYEEFQEVDNDGCVCTSYPLSYMKFNGEVITEFNWEPNNTGAAIIRK